MTPLKNTRHEAFAQARARNLPADTAYREAGYKPDRGHASKLASKSSVVARIREIQAAAATATVLTIAEKRAFLARLVRATAVSEPSDSDLWQEIQVTDKGVVRKMPDKLRALALDNDLSPDVDTQPNVTVVVKIGGFDDGND